MATASVVTPVTIWKVAAANPNTLGQCPSTGRRLDSTSAEVPGLFTEVFSSLGAWVPWLCLSAAWEASIHLPFGGLIPRSTASRPCAEGLLVLRALPPA